MGYYKYEVLAWTRDNDTEPFRDKTVYTGNWLVVAIFFAIHEKRKGIGCVSIRWR